MANRIFLKDYQKPNYLISNVDLSFDLDETKTIVSSKLKIQQQSSGDLKLNGVGLKLLKIELNGKTLEKINYEVQTEYLILKDPGLKEFELTTEVEINPSENTSLEGLYLSKNLLCTQCEAEGFRKITYFMDRPDVLSQFQVTLKADLKKYPVLLSNGNRIKSEKLSDGRHLVHYVDPSKKPCYLFALVGGDLGRIEKTWKTKSGRSVQLEVYSRPGTQSQCQHALVSLEQAMKWDETRFDLEYDLDNYMVVAVDDFNAGAMENKGLNIFNSKLVFADPRLATDDDYFHIESVVGHEYFHNWTGNRVTLRDWFQLSLKEGLTVFRDQEFSGDLSNRSLQRLRDVESLWKRQFPEDGSPSAHPIRPESCMAVDNFFTPTIYEKGAEVIRMIQTLLGRPLFTKGLQHYLKTNDGTAATVEDFIRSFEFVSGQDLSQLMSWYQQFGTPSLFVEESFNSGTGTLSISLMQKLFHLGKEKDFKAYLYPVEVQFLSSKGEKMTVEASGLVKNSEDQLLVVVRNKSEKIEIKNLKEKPVISWLRNYSAPVYLVEQKSFQENILILQAEDDFFQKRQIFQRLMQEFVSLELKGQRNEKDFSLFTETLADILMSPKIDWELKASLISPLEEPSYLQANPQTDVARLKKAVLQVSQLLAMQLKPVFDELQLQIEKKDIQNNFELRGPRQFMATLWYYGQWDKTSKQTSSLKKILSDSQNMTLVESAFKILVNAQQADCTEAIATFYKRYSDNPLTLNKWFSAQALSTRDSTPVLVEHLAQHPLFNLKNPNNVYALLRNFGQNLFQFHQGQESIYQFYLDQLVQIDALNPQVAARLCSAFQVLPLLSDSQRKMVSQKISEVLKANSLSKNTSELLQNYI